MELGLVTTDAPDAVETPAIESSKRAAHWKDQVKAHDEDNENWHRRGRDIIRRYRDSRHKAAEERARRLNILWSNTQIMRPAVYGHAPTPIIERRFLDHDTTGRMSAQMLERAVRNEIEENSFHRTMRQCVNDFLLPGRGVAWVRYEPKMGMSDSIPSSSEHDMTDEYGEVEWTEASPEEEKLEDTGAQIIDESVPVDYIAWQDFYMFPSRARTWKEVQAVGKKIYLSRDECIEHFGEEIGSKIRPDSSFLDSKTSVIDYQSVYFDRHQRSRVIFEIWNKTDRTVYWVSDGYQYLCKKMKDPLQLRNFFPVAEPMSSCLTNESLEPVPFFMEYQDQAIQIDELTHRISQLAKAAKVAGTYDASNRALKRLLDETVENELVPVEDWARHSEKGGLVGSISFMPLKEIIDALQVAVEVRQKIIEDCDRITGINDVLRGTTDARETMGGSRLKDNNSSMRIDEQKDEVARFCNDTIRLVVEVIAKHFTADSIIRISGVLYLEGISQDDLDDLFTDGSTAAPSALSSPPAPGGMRPGISGLLPPPPQAQGAPGLPMPVPGGPGAGAPMAPGPSAGGGQGAPAVAQAQPQGPKLPPATDPEANKKRVLESFKRIDKALKLMKNDIERGYRIDIETDSTISRNADAERSDAIEFTTMTVKFLETAQTIAVQNPAIVPLLGKMLQFSVRKFRSGRDLESAIDEYVEQAQKQAAIIAAQPPPPSPEQVKMQIEQAKAASEEKRAQMQFQMDQANDQRQSQMQAANDQRDFAKTQAEDNRKAQLQAAQDQRDEHIRMLEFRYKLEELNAELHFRRQEHEMNMRELSLKAEENDKARKDRETQRKQASTSK